MGEMDRMPSGRIKQKYRQRWHHLARFF